MAPVAAGASAVLPRHADAALTLVVEKSQRILRAESGRREIKRWPIALGSDPVTRKAREGDGATPEGRYVLIPHHASPSFGECFVVCYPNAEDAAAGRRDGVLTAGQERDIRAALEAGRAPPQDTPLGGLILVHGTADRSRLGLTSADWTLGCIAMENADVQELLAAFAPDDRPVLEIRP